MLRDQIGGCPHRGVLLTLIYRVVRCLYGLTAVLVRSDASSEAALLVLRRQLGGRPRWGRADRPWFAALSRLIQRR